MTFLHHIGAGNKALGITTKSIKEADFEGDSLREDFVDFAVHGLRVIHARLHLDSIFHSRRGGDGGVFAKRNVVIIA